MINPNIISKSEKKSKYEEGCLSIPGQFAEITRPEECTVEFLDYNGNKSKLALKDFLSTCIQHEIDHLNGILFIDYLSKLKKNMILKRLSKQSKKIKEESLYKGYAAKINFYGTPEFSLRTLEKIINSEHKVECVYTQSPKKKKKKKNLEAKNKKITCAFICRKILNSG